MKDKLTAVFFILSSILLMVSVFSLYHLYEMKEQEAQLEEFMKTLPVEEDESLLNQVKEISAMYEEQKFVNKELEELLKLRYHNLILGRNEGAEMPVLSKSGFTPEMFERAWEALGAEAMRGSGEEFVKAEEKTGVNALVLASIAVHETDWGESRLAQYNNNYFGWGAYDAAPLQHAHSFPSREESILTVANEMRSEYLSREGRHYKGESLEAISESYASDRLWAEKVGDVMQRITKNAVDNPEELENYFKQRQFTFDPEMNF